MTDEIRIQLPHHFTPRRYQIPLLDAMQSGCRRAVCVWHRRSGKDKTAINIVSERMFQRVGTYNYFFPTFKQGKNNIWHGMDKDGFRFLDHFPKEMLDTAPGAKMNESTLRLQYKKEFGGSAFQIMGSDSIDKSSLGSNPIGNVFSEFSVQNPTTWDFIRPILAENEGFAIFLYTPRGMNHGWKLLQQAKNDPFDPITNPYGWFSQVLTADDTGVLPQRVLDQERREMPQDLFEQEYYCKFIEGAGAFFRRITENVEATELFPVPGHRYQLGVDLAKYQDFTVITPIDLYDFKIGTPERFNRTDWPFVKSRIEATAHKFNHAKVWVDQTGLGDPIVDDLRKSGLNVEGYKFSEVSRRQLLDNLQLLLSQDRIRLPNDQTLIAELQSMAFTLTDTGSLKLNVPEGLHDDMIFSIALACWQLPSQPMRFYTRIEDGLEITDQPMEYRPDSY